MIRFRSGIAVAIFCLAAPLLHAQTGWVTVTASHLTAAGVNITNATATFCPVNASGNPLSFQVNGDGHSGRVCFSAAVTAGALSITLPDTNVTNPQNVCFLLTVRDKYGSLVLGGPGSGYTCLQPAQNTTVPNAWCASGACNLDIWTPNAAALVVQQSGPAGPQGPAGAAGPNAVTSATTTTFNAILKGNGANVAAAVAGTDYATPASVAAAQATANAALPANGCSSSSGGNISCPGTVTALATIGQKLRTALSLSPVNPTNQGPLIAPPAWVGATAYVVGQTVSNGGNYYICYTAGTSAASGGPTGTGNAPITDGGVTWLWLNSPLASTSPNAPTITSATSVPAALTSSYPMATSQAINPQFLMTGGGVVYSCASNAYTQCVQGVTTSTGAGASPFSLVFYTDAPKLTIDDCISGGSLTIDNQFAVYGAFPTAFSGGHCYTTIDFSAIGGRRSRRYEIFWTVGNPNTLGSIRVDPQSTIWKPQIANKLSICVFGDSTVQGGNLMPLTGADFWPDRVSMILGYTDPHNFGIGGTGFTAGWTYSQHISDITTYGPCDVIAFFGLYNDAGSSLATEQAAIVSTLTQARALAPAAPIFVFGAWPGSTGPDTGRQTMETAASQAVTQVADANTFFVPMITDPSGGWITGMGKVTAPTGVGNADVWVSSDGVHPTENAIIGYLARKISNAIQGVEQTIR